MTDIKTKEEILEDNSVIWCAEVEIEKQDVIKAMDIYTNQQIIEFGKWLAYNAYRPIYTERSTLWTKPISDTSYQTEHLYNRFIKETKKILEQSKQK